MKNSSRFAIPVSKTRIAIILISSLLFYLACKNADSPADKRVLADPSTIAFSYTVPTDIADPADSLQAAAFAWQEFIAVTWPAKINASPGPGLSGFFRAQPDSTAKPGSTGSGGTTVWETFYHRDELYPNYQNGLGNNVLPDPNAIPNYMYGDTITPAASGVNLNLFNNLDESSEITLANMYYTPLAEKADALIKSGNPSMDAGVRAGIMYEAKANPVIYNYVKTNGFNNPAPRRKARNNSISKITNQPVSGPVFELPYGSLEIKATWRHYDYTADNLNDFHWTVGIYYTSVPYNMTATSEVAHNDTLLLVSLHIIQKTPNVPTFTFATFEHVTNEKNGFRFINTNPLTDTASGLPRPLPDSGIIQAIRQFPIPDYLVKYNAAVQKKLRSLYGQDFVWANYQLVGLQAIVTNDPGGVVPPQQFFLSNFATETNDALQFFQGGLAGPSANVPDPNAAHVFKFDSTAKLYKAYTSGGCLGCHGSQGQYKGGDFSVIAATGNASFNPEPVRPYPGGKVSPQNPKGFPLPH